MSLVALAHLYVTQSRRDLKTEVPELTLPMALRLLTAALKQPVLTEAEALRLMQYHLRRNKTARESHRKTWLAKHKKLKAKPLL
jgi:hypothetical protein